MRAALITGFRAFQIVETGRQRLVTSAEGQPKEEDVPLPDNGWTDKQAQGLFERLNLDGGTPKWKWEHLHRLRSWCSAHGKDSATIDGQLEFVAADLCDTYEGIGMALMRATTVEEARAAVAPYINRITATNTLPSVKSLRGGEADLLRFGT
jgi:hypothetical protein